jgi:hypothetical protein
MRKLLFLAFITLLLSFTPISVIATDETDLLGVLPTQNEYTQLNSIRPAHLVGAAITLLLGGSGVVSFVYLLWGGIQWITSHGDKDGIDRARKKIVAALLGLSIVFSSYALLFVVQTMFGIQIIRLDLQYIENTNYPEIPAVPAASCGNSSCEPGLGENCTNCSADCTCPPPQCGNGTCQADIGETCSTCSADCTCPPPTYCGGGTNINDCADMGGGQYVICVPYGVQIGTNPNCNCNPDMQWPQNCPVVSCSDNVQTPCP